MLCLPTQGLRGTTPTRTPAPAVYVKCGLDSPALPLVVPYPPQEPGGHGKRPGSVGSFFTQLDAGAGLAHAGRRPDATQPLRYDLGPTPWGWNGTTSQLSRIGARQTTDERCGESWCSAIGLPTPIAGTMSCRSWLGEASKAADAIGFQGTSSEVTWLDSMTGLICCPTPICAVLAPPDSKWDPGLSIYR